MSVFHRFTFHPDVILVLSGICIVFIVPEFSFLPAGCLINKITGLYCGGCGISRCVHAFLRGDINLAMHQNLMFVTVLPLSLFWYSLRFFLPKYSDKIKTFDKAIIPFFIITVIIFVILRNIPSPYFDFLKPV